VYLGADVPVVQLETAVKSIQPHMVILSAQTLITAGRLLPMAFLLQTLNIPLAFGGAVFNYLPDARKQIPGHFLGDQLQQVPDRVSQLLEMRPSLPFIPLISNQYNAALLHFVDQRAAIEATIHEMDSIEGVPSALMNYANEDFGNNIEAALRLGDINLITANINWVHGLLMNYHYRMPERLMHRYISMYYDAAKVNLDERADPLFTWLLSLMKSAIELEAKD
jgi:MerR family transcriptional regulator, light-induced transcriptional regulator